MAIPHTAKVQHYVPQFMLRNFGTGKKDHVFVFDKSTGRTFRTNVRNVASESRFYDFHVGQTSLTTEPFLAELEGRAKSLLQRLLESNTTNVYQPAERALLGAFLAIQFTRTRTFREQLGALPAMLGDKLRAMATRPEDLDSVLQYIEPLDENTIKLESSRMMASAPRDFGPHFLAKTWHILTTSRKNPFVISDNPLALQNIHDMRPFGNLGLAVTGIEIYLPLSPTRSLAMWCPSHKAQILKAAEQLEQMQRLAPHLVSSQVKNPELIRSLAESMRNNSPLAYTAENVTNFNSLQIGNAERYVFSHVNEFGLAREMLDNHPALRTGPRMEVV